MTRFNYLLAFTLAGLWTAGPLLAQTDTPAKPLMEVHKIWDKAPHNAFTDLVRFNDRWYCAFREGKAHTGGIAGQGKLRVIASDDGQEWKSVGLFDSPLGDMRDGKLSVTADGKLLLASAMQIYEPDPHRHQSLSWLSADGKTWSEANRVGDPDFWIWGVSWNKGHGYGIGYKTVEPRFVRLYRTADGQKFETLVPDLKVKSNYPNESCIVFAPDETAYCLLRCDGPAQIGQSKPPYKDWNWKETKTSIGGPEMIRLHDGRLLAGVRLYRPKAHTALCWVDPQAGTITEALRAPLGRRHQLPGHGAA